MPRYQKVLIATMLCCCDLGCRQAVTSLPPAHVLPVSVRAASPAPTVSVAAKADPSVVAISQIRTTSLYNQAEAACARKQYKLASELLVELSHTPGLSAPQVEFCQTQIDVCRKDTGLKPLSIHPPPLPLPPGLSCIISQRGSEGKALLCELPTRFHVFKAP